MSNNQKKSKVEKAVDALIIVLILLIVSTAVLYSVKYFNQNDPVSVDKPQVERPVIEKEKIDLSQLDNEKAQSGKLDLSQIEVKQATIGKGDEYVLNTNIVLEDGQSEGKLLIENREGNKYLLQAQIFLKENNELIYTSSILKPNEHIETDKLDKALKKGTYNAYAIYKGYDQETGKVKARGGAVTRITVLN